MSLECANALDWLDNYRRTSWNRKAIEGDSPVFEMILYSIDMVLEYSGTREILLEFGVTMLQG